MNQFGQNNRFDCFNITIFDDNLLEFTEEFTVMAQVDPGTPVEILPNTTTIIIMDNDGKDSTTLIQLL